MLTAARRLLRLDGHVRPPSFESPNAAVFFRSLDRFQQAAFGSLRRRYREPGGDSFCQIVALKAANAFAAGYHFRHRHAALVSRPMQLQVDPTNACHMRCPSCLHSANTAWSSRFDWPPATLGVPEFAEFCSEFGPFATTATLFRDGEPLLHRRFPEFVKLAKSHLLYTLTSTSLSVRLDAEALVASGLDRLVASIDGASAGTYSRYRRGGDFGLVMDNLRALVQARKAHSSGKPWLVWQFLAFEHNAHEVEAAARMAREVGIDQFVVARPHSVEHDDPSIQVAEKAAYGETVFAEIRNWCGEEERLSVDCNADRIDARFHESWADRYDATGAHEENSGAGGPACRWLYFSLTMDAARRVTPCCLPPMGPPEPRHLVFAKFDGKNAEEVVNSVDATLARRHCRSGSVQDAETRKPLPFCVTCAHNAQPPVFPDAARYLASVDERKALPPAIHAALAASPLFLQGH